MSMKLLQRLDHHACSAPARIAYRELAVPGRTLTYLQLRDAAFAFAAHLRTLVQPGAVVMLALPNRLEYPIAFLGVLAAGCCVFPVSSEMVDVEMQALAAEAKVAAIVGASRAAAALKNQISLAISIDEVLSVKPSAAFAPADSSGDLLLCSSGTTARPKIVLRSADSLDAVSSAMCQAIGFTPDDRVLSIVPLCHSYGLEHGLLAPVWAGSAVHLSPGLDLSIVMPQLTTAGITLFPSVPSAYDMICQVAHPHPLPTLRQAYAAGAPLPKSVSDAFHERFGVQIGQLYGATEIGSVTFANPAAPHFDPQSVGAPYPEVELRIVDPETRHPQTTNIPGELLIRAPSMFQGYLHQTTPSTIDGFFPTGDLARVDTFGNLTITGRLKLLIEIGGLKVNVLEVEELLASHPTIAEAAVVAIPVSDTVSRLKAVITPRDPNHPPVPDDIRKFLRARLTAYKVPRVIEVRDSLPRSAAGKILRRLLESP
jgi:long-chain acyl-CoA synthetase